MFFQVCHFNIKTSHAVLEHASQLCLILISLIHNKFVCHLLLCAFVLFESVVLFFVLSTIHK